MRDELYYMKKIDGELRELTERVRSLEGEIHMRNRKGHWVELEDGSEIRLSEYCRRFGRNYNTLSQRIRRGYTTKEAVKMEKIDENIIPS